MQALAWEGPEGDAGEASSSWAGEASHSHTADSPYDSGYNPSDWGTRSPLLDCTPVSRDRASPCTLGPVHTRHIELQLKPFPTKFLTIFDMQLISNMDG